MDTLEKREKGERKKERNNLISQEREEGKKDFHFQEVANLRRG